MIGSVILKEEILRYLIENKNTFISGEKISKKLNISRVAVWKYITALKEEGFVIDSVPNKGYMLVNNPIELHPLEIKKSLSTDFIGNNVYYFDSLDSTSKKAKEYYEENGAVVISEEQTQGKGRLGRAWCSPKYKGLWFSIVLTPKIEPQYAPKISHIAAAAVIKSLTEIGFKDVKCKWPNDILIKDKKVCGILTELSAELNMINYIIIGIGINVNLDKEDIPDDLKDKAFSLKLASGEEVNRKSLLVHILNNLEPLYKDFEDNMDIKSSLEICRKHSAVIGKEVYIINKGVSEKVEVMDIDSEGELIIKDCHGEIKSIISGEVSVRGLNGYI